ncbi:DUF4268 domain-containing protein [Candidatus Saccharibacteria bacterium]|nr:DUF4268 domain-containing protein [Candidatus Saccharibacteria bacterium]MBI3338343.1 DUF4268 domain-containing protein [Candidatus Saccharibacteria bacterium]
MKLGKIEDVALRNIWINEARDFTPWLAVQENLDYLGEILGLNLVEAEQEVSVGSFSADIHCKIENDNRTVIIENQIESSNHDHLGKTIVYASGVDASVIVWIVKNARPEHVSAVEWLNDHTDSDIGFFLVEIHAIKIGNSDPAPQFKIIAQPNEYMKSVKTGSDKELTRSQLGRYEFWTQLNTYIEESGVKLAARKPNYDHWYDFKLGSSKYHMTVNLLDGENKIRVALWISNDKEIFDGLYANKEAIESAYGTNLEWDRKDLQKASWVADYITGFSYDDQTNWLELQKSIINKVLDFQKALKPYLGKVQTLKGQPYVG